MVKLQFFCLLLLSLTEKSFGDLHNPEPTDITYYLFNRYTGDGGQIIDYRNDTSIKAYLNSSLFTYVVVHGFGEDVPNTYWMLETKDLILTKGESNVILVDWGVLTAQPFYEAAVKNTFFTGEDLANLLLTLKKTENLQLEKVHLIGFSLGCHVVGVTGYETKGIGRITGLDPAEPQFKMKPLSKRLDKSDASFVDVVHTNSGMFITGHLSFFEPIGHVDFYPNGGHDQYGCPTLEREIIDYMEGKGPPPGCSHRRSHLYFTESLKGYNFIGYKCSNYESYQEGHCSEEKNILGLSAKRENEGKFFMETYDIPPFSAYQIKVTFDISTSTKGRLMLINNAGNYSEKQYTIFKGRVKSGDIYTHVMAAPQSDFKNLLLKLEYEPKYSQPSTIVVKTIFGFDLNSNKSLCLGTNLTVSEEDPLILSVTKGPCFVYQ